VRYLAAIFCAIFLVACKPPTFEDGWAAIKAKDKHKHKAIEIFTPLADKGDVRAQTELGVIYSSKELNDPARAFKYYKLAADQGQMWGNYNVGNAYEEGKVVEKNLGYAEQRYLKAANEGLVLAAEPLVFIFRQTNPDQTLGIGGIRTRRFSFSI
jgi:TPR repeat protein